MPASHASIHRSTLAGSDPAPASTRTSGSHHGAPGVNRKVLAPFTPAEGANTFGTTVPNLPL